MSKDQIERQIEAAELAKGARVLRMLQTADLRLKPHEHIRLFTNALSGCVVIGRVALLNDGHRLAYMQHASYGDVCERSVDVKPLTDPRTKAIKGVIMLESFEPLSPFKASAPNIPYGAIGISDNLQPITNDLVKACGNAEAVTIVPYYREVSYLQPYARSMVIDVPPFEIGTILAEGQSVM